MKIRKGQTGDAVCLAAIGQCVWVDTYATSGVRSNIASYVLDEFTVGKLEHMVKTKNVYVVEKDDHLIGYMVTSKDDEPEIESLYILPWFQRQGFGTCLLEHMGQLFGRFRSSCWEKNLEAIQFYQAFGFTESGENFFELEDEKHRNIVFKFESPVSNN